MTQIALTKQHTYRLRTALKLRKVFFDVAKFNEEDYMFLFNFNNNQSAVSHNDRDWFQYIDSKFITTDMQSEDLIDCVQATVMFNLFDMKREIAKQGQLKGYAKINEKRLDELLIDSIVDLKLQATFDTAFNFYKGIKKLNHNWEGQDANNRSYNKDLQEQVELLLLDLATIIVIPILALRLNYKFKRSADLSIKASKVLNDLYKVADENKTLSVAMDLKNHVDKSYNYTKKCFRECLDLANWYADDLNQIYSRKKSYETFYDGDFKRLYQELKQKHFNKAEMIEIQE
ncbi:hypothetical protein [Vibrio jasicida]|uniref:hypothetical protein n=1 Tax=Vibrio jasicida TaxID=766224 RepID=UPI0005EF1E5E|nr:hypothetical protein [Vibrio jasicida]